MKTNYSVLESEIVKDFIVAEIETIIEQGGPQTNQYAYQNNTLNS